MHNHIRQRPDGSFEIGMWNLYPDDIPRFSDLAEAPDLEKAIEIAEALDEYFFSQAKFEIDIIGGIESANTILDNLKKTKTFAIIFEKDKFDLETVQYLDEAKYKEWYAILNESESTYFKYTVVHDICIILNLKEIRFLTF